LKKNYFFGIIIKLKGGEMKNIIKIKFFLLFVFNNGMANVIVNSYAVTCDLGNTEKVYSVYYTTDNSYIMAGYTNSFGAGNNDFLVIKLEPYGFPEWIKAFGGRNDDYAYSIQQTTYGGYIVAGKTNSFGKGDYDILVINLSSTGSINWSRTINRLGDDVAYFVKQTSSNDYIIAGCSSLDTNSEVLVIKLNYNGDLIWAKTFGGIGNDESYSLEETSGGYIVVGRTNSFGAGNYDVLVMKLDNAGNLIWAKTFGLEGDDEGYSIQKTNDGGYIVVGRTNSFGAGNYDVLVMKLDNAGNLIWAKTFGLGDDDEAYSVQNATGYGYVVVGRTRHFDTGYDVFAMKLDNMGNLLETKIFENSQNDQAYSISIQSIDYGYMIVGSTLMNTEDVLLIKTFDEIQMPFSCPWWNRTFTTVIPTFSINEVFDTIPDTLSVQIDTVIPMDTSVLTLPFIICTGMIVEEIGFTPTPLYLDAFPTVGKNFHIGFGIPYKAKVRLEIFDIKGSLQKLLLEKNLEPGKYIMDLNLPFKEGAYFLVLKLIDKKRQKEVKKLILIK
jgi:uncharacterized protein (DUF2147 family)